jgi:hypothetical protein
MQEMTTIRLERLNCRIRPPSVKAMIVMTPLRAAPINDPSDNRP